MAYPDALLDQVIFVALQLQLHFVSRAFHLLLHPVSPVQVRRCIGIIRGNLAKI